jgi:hypothetical protein
MDLPTRLAFPARKKRAHINNPFALRGWKDPGELQRGVQMKLSPCLTVLAVFCSATIAHSQKSPSASPASGGSPARTDVYHVHFNHAAPGKASALADFLKNPGANAPMPGHLLVLRHEDGAPWDYVAIQHLGTKATVEAAGNPRGQAMRTLSDWHDDTFVNGPSWAEFAKAMGIDDAGKSKSTESVYVVSVYRPLPGHEDALEKFLSEPPSASNDLAVGTILMQHLEGGHGGILPSLVISPGRITPRAKSTASRKPPKDRVGGSSCGNTRPSTTTRSPRGLPPERVFFGVA